MPEENQNHGTRIRLIEDTPFATIWRWALLTVSAILFAKAAAGFVNDDVIENLGNLGLSIIFIALHFRDREAAIMAYVPYSVQRTKVLIRLRKEEKIKRPWMHLLIRGGWIILLTGVSLQVALALKLM